MRTIWGQKPTKNFRANLKNVKKCIICKGTLPMFNKSKHPNKICMKGTCLEKYKNS